jgi:P27 family predicted phage terminase small subunit
MGRRGPAPTPTALKILRGNPGRRPLNQQEARPPARLPSAPPILDPVARAEWRRVCKVLGLVGLVTQADRAALTAYCVAWSRWLAAEAKVREFGALVRTARGGQGLSPYLRVANTALAQMRTFAVEFGMSPSARSRIQVEKPAPESAIEAFTRKHQDP